MSWEFDPKEGLVIVGAEVCGPSGSGVIRMAVDTGATHSIVSTNAVVRYGYQPQLSPNRVQVATGSGVEYAPVISLSRFHALGQSSEHFSVSVISLPQRATIEGVIGLDFLRGHVLTLDFKQGRIFLA